MNTKRIQEFAEEIKEFNRKIEGKIAYIVD